MSAIDRVKELLAEAEEPGPTCVWCGAMDTWRHTKDGVVWERGCQCAALRMDGLERQMKKT